jgi:subtilase family serine protease
MQSEKCVKDELIYNSLEDKAEQKDITEGIKQEDIITEIKMEQQPQKYKNYKEKLYDKIPISLKTLDIIITILIAIFIILMVYFIIRNF